MSLIARTLLAMALAFDRERVIDEIAEEVARRVSREIQGALQTAIEERRQHGLGS